VAVEEEEVERHALAAIHGAADDVQKAGLELQSVNVGGALVSIAGALPLSSIVVNRAIGLGLSGPEDPETIHRIVALYRDAGVARYFIHVHPDAQPPEIRDWLLEAGLEKARGWMKFTRGRDAPPPADTDLTVRPAETADGPAFLDFRDQDAKGLFETNLANAVQWLVSQQKKNGSFKGRYSYSTPIAVMALGQAASSSAAKPSSDTAGTSGVSGCESRWM